MVRREIAYMIPANDGNGDEFCVRNCCYQNSEEWKAMVKKTIPSRIDIGAYFTGDVKHHKNKLKDLSIKPKEREFVIDIDMTDYDGIRTCC